MDKIHNPKGSPREIYARFYPHLISEERMRAWEERAECLCGCGRQTRVMAHGRGMYKNAYSFWYEWDYHHWRRINGLPGHHGVENRKPSWAINNRRARKKSIEENFVSPLGIAALVREYLETNNLAFTPWAKQHGFSVEHTRRIISGKGPARIHPRTALKLLEAIGEKPNPALLEYLKKAA